jgi:hypothetical protein
MNNMLYYTHHILCMSHATFLLQLTHLQREMNEASLVIAADEDQIKRVGDDWYAPDQQSQLADLDEHIISIRDPLIAKGVAIMTPFCGIDRATRDAIQALSVIELSMEATTELYEQYRLRDHQIYLEFNLEHDDYSIDTGLSIEHGNTSRQAYEVLRLYINQMLVINTAYGSK